MGIHLLTLLVLRLGEVVLYPVFTTLIPYAGFFPYHDHLPLLHVPAFVYSWASFDGIHYLNIARFGYDQYEQAFFPLYPIVIHLFTYFTHNALIASLIVSNLSFFAGLIIFAKFLQRVIHREQSSWTIFFLLSFPTAFFFSATYTEGFFFLLVSGTLYLLKTKRYFLAALLTIFASATRLIGVFLIIPFAFELFYSPGLFRGHKITVSWKKILLLLPLVFSPFLGLIAYMTYLQFSTGDSLLFFHAQSMFGAHRATHLILLPQVWYRYVKIFMTAAHNFQFWISLLEFTFFNGMFALLIMDFIVWIKKTRSPQFATRISLNLFSLANLILPTLTGTFSSIPRYVLFSLSAILVLGEIKSRALKIILLATFTLAQVLLLGLFLQGYFIS
ncbi:hypothetical protein HGB07_00560 [Candidatus Roizmanbacteria bacterium]|nr:hypothetical protein [Candidatus Roizmanbacteria bacterium]